MGWIEFTLAFLTFFATHSIPVRPPVRGWLVGRLGQRGFGLVYSMLSLVVLGWLITAARRAPYIGLWPWAPWQPYVPLIAMALVCMIVALALGRPNPFSFGGARNSPFDPERPGIVRWTRHPLLLALAIWAAAHMVPNGDLAHVIVFGSFAAFAVFGRRMVDRRKQRELGDDWVRLNETVKATPHFSWPGTVPGLAKRATAAVALYVGLIALHPIVFGVSCRLALNADNLISLIAIG